MKKLLIEIINEADKLSVFQLEIFKEKWTKYLKSEGAPEITIALCKKIIDLVIDRKKEVQNHAITK